jgi:hypothetical protein
MAAGSAVAGTRLAEYNPRFAENPETPMGGFFQPIFFA